MNAWLTTTAVTHKPGAITTSPGIGVCATRDTTATGYTAKVSKLAITYISITTKLLPCTTANDLNTSEAKELWRMILIKFGQVWRNVLYSCTEVHLCDILVGWFVESSMSQSVFQICFFFPDIDECVETHTCDDNAICTNSPGSFECHCKRGYEGDGLNCEPIG